MAATCKIPECGRNCKGHGLCDMHYQRWRRHGDATVRNFQGIPPFPPESILDKLDKSGECWEWMGTRDRHGYGQVHMRNISTRLAHRAVYELLVGPIPAGMVLMHSCDNPPCCRPEHLRPGMQAENQLDSKRKGRTRNGITKAREQGAHLDAARPTDAAGAGEGGGL